jgi:1,4-dihydroxy-2-naphthoate octaprenyltransferase
VVRLGVARAGRLYAVATVAGYASLPGLVALGLPSTVALAAALPVPLAIWRAQRVLAGEGGAPERWEAVTFWSVALLVLTGFAELAGFLISGATAFPPPLR